MANTIEEYIGESYQHNSVLESHLYGVIDKMGFRGRQPSYRVGPDDNDKLWSHFCHYTGIPNKSHSLHGGDSSVTLKQFVDSAADAYGEK